MRSFPIVNITPPVGPSIPASFEISFDHTESFHGKEWVRYPTTGGVVRSPWYAFDADPATGTPPPPVIAGAATVTLLATTFDVVNNTKYNGRYTVYTKLTSTDIDSVELNSFGNTLIRVNESMPAGTGAELTTGDITNISTFVINEYGASSIILLEQQDDRTRPLELTGHRTNGWGEILFQNMVKHVQNFAGLTAPANPFVGQLWFNAGANILMVYQIGGWAVINGVDASALPYYHDQSSASTTWTISHNLALPAPYTCSIDCFVNTSGVYKLVFPGDVTFIDSNTLSITFTSAFSGRATVRK
jgi:hypothetical protein